MRKLIVAIIVLIALAPFSTSIPCFKLGLEGLAKVLSLTQSLPSFIVWVAVLSLVRRRQWKLIVLEALVLNLAVLILKEAFMRPRPPGSTAFSFGYPSGHSARALWVALHLSEVYPSFKPLFLIYALLVGWSRIELCQHYPIDIIGGYLVAYSVLEGSRLIRRKGEGKGVANEGNRNR